MLAFHQCRLKALSRLHFEGLAVAAAMGDAQHGIKPVTMADAICIQGGASQRVRVGVSS